MHLGVWPRGRAAGRAGRSCPWRRALRRWRRDGGRRVVVLRLGVPGQADHRRPASPRSRARPATPGPGGSGRRAAAGRRSRRAPRRRRPSRPPPRWSSRAASPGRAATGRPASARPAGRAAGWRRSPATACSLASGRAAIAAAENATPASEPSTTEPSAPCSRTAKKPSTAITASATRQADHPGGAELARMRRLGGQHQRGDPGQQQAEQRDLGAAARSTSAPVRRAGPSRPRPAATLACTRNSGRSRRARKASTNPSTWQTEPEQVRAVTGQPHQQLRVEGVVHGGARRGRGLQQVGHAVRERSSRRGRTSPGTPPGENRPAFRRALSDEPVASPSASQPSRMSSCRWPFVAMALPSPGAGLPGEVGEGAAGLGDDRDQRGHVPQRQLRLDHDVEGALGQQHVAVEVAVRAAAPGSRMMSSIGSSRPVSSQPCRLAVAETGVGELAHRRRR